MAHSRGRKGVRTKDMVQIARERVEILFRLAGEMAEKRKYDRANRYARLAVKIGMRYNVRIPEKFRFQYCRNCKIYLVPGVNLRLRLRKGKRVATCIVCGRKRRLPYRTIVKNMKKLRQPAKQR